MVESYIALEGDPVFIADSGGAGVHIPDSEIWRMVQEGELNGFSIKNPRNA